jgi:hypothetical protein
MTCDANNNRSVLVESNRVARLPVGSFVEKPLPVVHLEAGAATTLEHRIEQCQEGARQNSSTQAGEDFCPAPVPRIKPRRNLPPQLAIGYAGQTAMFKKCG